jgi:putative ABC transport system ATP-binding protein
VLGVHKDYPLGRTVVAALRGIDARFPAGSFTVIGGPSGSGKSTLLNLLGCLDSPGSGIVSIAGTNVGSLNDAQRTEFRARHIGFVFQNFNLLPVLTVQENVEYPLQLTLADAGERKRRAEAALASVGLAGMGGRRPSELSGGQRQRVAVARALVRQPALVLADEPTANLDQRTGAELIALMHAMQRDSGTTFILSSHDPQLIRDADRQIWIEDGRVVHTSEGSRAAAAAVTGERP